jgi:hypothetical protein
MTTTERVQQLTRQFMRGHSGGEKFSSVLTFIINAMMAAGVRLEPNDIESAIRAMPDMRILDYGWNMGGTWREKMFVYTPLPETAETAKLGKYFDELI